MNDFPSLKPSSISLCIFSILKKFQTLCCLALCLMTLLESISHYGAGGVQKRAKVTVAWSKELRRSGMAQDVRNRILLMIEENCFWKKYFWNFFHEKRDFWTKNSEKRGPLCCPLSYMAEWWLKKSKKYT